MKRTGLIRGDEARRVYIRVSRDPGAARYDLRFFAAEALSSS
jgi:hypothetical protein